MQIIIPSRPVPYKRTTQKQKFVDPQYKKYQAYKQLVQWHCKCKNKLTGFLNVKVDVYLYGKTTPMGNDGDIDNYIKSALDSLNGVAYEDDRQVLRVIGEKHIAQNKEDERMEIVVEVI